VLRVGDHLKQNVRTAFGDGDESCLLCRGVSLTYVNVRRFSGGTAAFRGMIDPEGEGITYIRNVE
jgi:hypothetical protein